MTRLCRLTIALLSIFLASLCGAAPEAPSGISINPVTPKEDVADCVLPDRPLIISSPGVLAVLAAVTSLFFFLQRKTKWRLFDYFPPLVFIYLMPVALSNGGVIPTESAVYDFMTDSLLPVLGIAVRSIRGPEQRAGLSAIVGLRERVPGLDDRIRGMLPDLILEPEARIP